MKLSFHPATEKQRLLIHQWLAQDYVAKYFYGQGLQNTLEDLEKFYQGHALLEHWIAYSEDTPFAYLLTSPVKKTKDEYAKWVEGRPAITLDLLIGDKNFLGKGIATPMIKAFLSDKFPQISEVLIGPEKTNKKAIHVYEKAGFKIMGTFVPSHSPAPHVMMKWKRTGNDHP